MNLLSLLPFTRPSQRAQRAHVFTNTCRGYYVELLSAGGADRRVLTDRRGRAIPFKTLDAVRRDLRRRGVRSALLVQQHACEEVGALGTSANDPERDGVAILRAER